jgi:hypothetical protein
MPPEQPRMPAVSCHVSSNSSLFSQALPLLPAVRSRLTQAAQGNQTSAIGLSRLPSTAGGCLRSQASRHPRARRQNLTQVRTRREAAAGHRAPLRQSWRCAVRRLP